MLIAFASPRAPEQERDVLTTSADSLQPLRPHPPLPSSPPKKRVVFAPDDNTGCPPPPPPHRRSVRDPKIPIGPAQPNRVLLTRLSDAGPAPSPSPPAKGRRPKPSYEGPEVNHQMLVSVNSDLSDRVSSLPTSYPAGSSDP